MNINLDLNNDDKNFKGDTLVIPVLVNEDITGWEIRAELSDLTGNSSKLATANITGGSTDQITIIDATSGSFTLTFASGETTGFDDKATLEIERVDGTNKKTIDQRELELKDEKINWTDNE